MVKFAEPFNSDEIDPNAPMEVLPAGWYAMRIVASSLEAAKSNPQNQYVKLTFEVDETRHPELRGRKVFSNLNLWNKNPTAVQIAQGDLSAICRAIGVPQFQDTEELHGRPLAVKVTVRPPRGDWGEQNEVKGYEHVDKHFKAGGKSSPKPQPAGPSPQQAAQASDTPPWG